MNTKNYQQPSVFLCLPVSNIESWLMGIILRPDKSLLSRDSLTHTHTLKAKYQSEMALKQLNERLKAEMTMFSGRL